MPRRHGLPRVRRAVPWWAAGCAVYVSFVTFVWTQVVAGAVVAALAAGLSWLALRSGDVRVAGAAPQLWRVRAVAAILVGEVRAVVAVLAAQVTGRRSASGRFVVVPLSSRPDAGADAAVTIEASVAPNTYVVGVLEEGGRAMLLVHQLQAQDGVRRSFPRWRR